MLRSCKISNNDPIVFELRLFYIFLAVVLWTCKARIPLLSFPLSSEAAVWAVAPFVSTLSFKFAYGIYLFALLTTILTALYPQRFPLRLVSAVFTTILIALINSSGKISHDLINWVPASILMASTVNMMDERFDRFKRMLVGYTASIYLAAGIWKLRGALLSSTDLKIYEALTRWMPEQIAFMRASGLNRFDPWSEVFIAHPNLSALAWLATVSFQLLIPILILQPRFSILAGILLLAFHMITDIVLSTPFLGQVLLIVFIFLVSGRNTEFTKQDHDAVQT